MNNENVLLNVKKLCASAITTLKEESPESEKTKALLFEILQEVCENLGPKHLIGKPALQFGGNEGGTFRIIKENDGPREWADECVNHFKNC